MRNFRTISCLNLILSLLALATAPAIAGDIGSGAGISQSSNPTAGSTISPGTVITSQNWQQYRQFMPYGMTVLFEGQASWKMPPDVQMPVGPTVINPLPLSYLAATEKYSPTTKLVELPDGGLTIGDYQGGIPFPNPKEPHQGWKILSDMWYSYVPHIVVNSPNNPVFYCTLDDFSNVSCAKALWVARQLSDNTDPGTPQEFPGAKGKFRTEWFMTEEPEQYRYATTLTIVYTDLTKPEDVYEFVPAIRRTQRLSSFGRCTTSLSEPMPDFSADLLNSQRILAQMDIGSAGANFPADYDMPLGWSKPSWGKWELRDSYVLDVRKLPGKSAAYCYGKLIVYVDKQFYGALWQDFYDPKMQLWKVALLQPIVTKVPRIGPQNSSGAEIYHWWDLQTHHATFEGPANGHGYNVLINDDVPAPYLDLDRYTTLGGLYGVMR